jgi:hypothetical protein
MLEVAGVVKTGVAAPCVSAASPVTKLLAITLRTVLKLTTVESVV